MTLLMGSSSMILMNIIFISLGCGPSRIRQLGKMISEYNLRIDEV